MKKCSILLSVVATSLTITTVFADNATSHPAIQTTNSAKPIVVTPKMTPVVVKKNDVNATLTLTKNNHKLYARITVTQNSNQPGTIEVLWKAPANSKCKNSHYTLNYRYNKFHTNAYRSIARCPGTWQVMVMKQDQQLAQATFVEPSNSTNTKTLKGQKTSSNAGVMNKHLSLIVGSYPNG